MSKENKEKPEKVYSYCYEDKFSEEDIENRYIHLNCDIDETTLDTVVYHILRYNRLDKDIPVKERKPIIVYINSNGGNVVDGYGIIDAISSSITPVYTVNLGACFSMALLIFIAGHKRFSMPSSEFLLHDGFVGGFDSSMKLQDRMEFNSKQIEAMTKKYVLSRTNIDESQYNENLRKEWYFLPREGMDIGVVDHIIGINSSITDII